MAAARIKALESRSLWNNARGFRRLAAVHIIPRFWILTFGLLLLLRAPSLVVDVLDPDEAGHAVNAIVWMDGGTPYVDFADNKQPLVYAAFALAFGAFGRSLIVVHALTLPWLLANAWLLGAMAAAAWPAPRTRHWAALLFVLGGSAYLEKDMLATNTEVLMNLPLTAAFWVQAGWRRRGTALSVLTSGLLAGIALLFNLKALLAFPALLIAVAGGCGALGWRRAPMWLVSAALMPTLAAIYFWTRGALDDAWFWNVSGNVRYAALGLPLGATGVSGGVLYGFPRLLLFGLATIPLWAGAAVAACRAWRNPTLGPAPLVALAWLAGSLAGACLGGRFYGHYFIALLPPLAWLASGPMAALFDRRIGEAPAMIMWTRRAAVVLLVLPILGLTIAGWIRIAGRHLDALRPEVSEVARAVRQRTAAGDRIFVWGYWPQLYYVAGRPPATRFVFPQTLSGYVPGRPDLLARPPDDRHVVEAHWSQWAEDMARHPAELIVDTAPAAIHYWERHPVERYAPLARLLEERYRLDTTVAGVDIYRRTRDGGRQE